jgi:hypothetical protein
MIETCEILYFGNSDFENSDLFGIWCLVFGISSFAYLSIPVDNKFCGRQFLQSHGTKGMNLRGADPYLSAQSQFESVIEPRRGID